MSSKNPNNQEGKNSIPQKGGKSNTFAQLMRDYEQAVASCKDVIEELTALATAIAYSVLNKCIDPQRKRGADKPATSKSTYNQRLAAVKRGLAADIHLLDNTRDMASKATKAGYNADGDYITQIVDKDAEKALEKLLENALSDGIDLMQSAVVAILEQTAAHAASGGQWLEKPYTMRTLSRRVYIQKEDSAAYKEIETTPIQEIYRAVRRVIQDSRAVQADPRNGYTYIEGMEPEGLEKIYFRLLKYADLGGRDCIGNYTADSQTAADYNTIISRLCLTDRQAAMLKLRMQGMGYKAIASYLGVRPATVQKTMARIQNKALSLGYRPKGYNTR